MLPEKINILQSAEVQIADVFQPHIVGDVNDYQVKVAKFGEIFDWHTHRDEDEAFLVLRGRIAVDFRDGSVELADGDYLAVRRGIEHRPRSLSHEPIVLMFEAASTLNTGDVETDRTVRDLHRLKPISAGE